jgi:hypothetical protein
LVSTVNTKARRRRWCRSEFGPGRTTPAAETAQSMFGRSITPRRDGPHINRIRATAARLDESTSTVPSVSSVADHPWGEPTVAWTMQQIGRSL